MELERVSPITIVKVCQAALLDVVVNFLLFFFYPRSIHATVFHAETISFSLRLPTRRGNPDVVRGCVVSLYRDSDLHYFLFPLRVTQTRTHVCGVTPSCPLDVLHSTVSRAQTRAPTTVCQPINSDFDIFMVLTVETHPPSLLKAIR